ncbi:hypothetical protein Zm00014a_023574 [Zea mays]|uniref:Uncharacterized protein n=1 Tax=Zea mays TaxID=4577 RepID=A0A3L6EC47_MAIZE|nr:hypothetical protein Zm00014a_023574 [Zea mays]
MTTTNPTAILSVVLLIAGVAVMLVAHILVVFWALLRGLGSRGSSQHAANQEDRVETAAAGDCPAASSLRFLAMSTSRLPQTEKRPGLRGLPRGVRGR